MKTHECICGFRNCQDPIYLKDRSSSREEELQKALIAITVRHFHNSVNCDECDYAKNVLIKYNLVTIHGPRLVPLEK